MHLADLPTPQVLIDLPRLRANIDRMQAAASARSIRLRPHAKTHKSPVIARWQIERGAIGICCAKLGEAEVFADAGIADIRLPYPIHPSNAARLLALMDRAHISIIVDHLDVATAWSSSMRQARRTLDILIKVDVGFHRCGIDPALPDALTFIRRIAELPGLRLAGLLSHAGHAYGASDTSDLPEIARQEAATLNELAASARKEGIALDELSVGATPTARFSVNEPGLTEMRPGNYVYFDRSQVRLGAATLDDCALRVLATVVSKPARDRIILDCGSKTLSSDRPGGSGSLAGYGVVLSGDSLGEGREDRTAVDETLSVERLSEEHATVRVLSGSTPLVPGDRVTVLPNHSCVVSNLVDCIRLVKGTRVVETLPVAARGRIT